MIGCQATINLDAFTHNLKRVRAMAPKAKLLAMLKANAYGHDIAALIPTFNLIDAIGVARLEEASLLRQLGIQHPIVVMSGFHDSADLYAMAEQNIDTVVHQQRQIQCLKNTTLKKPINVWLKTDTGMHRLGIYPDQVKTAFDQLTACQSVNHLTLMTHLACADDSNQTKTDQQLTAFSQALASIKSPVQTSIGNSATLLQHKAAQSDIIRPGILLYGISPLINTTASDYQLQPVMTLHAPIIDIKTINKGDTVGYGATWKATKTTTIAIVAIGYGDGYPQNAPNGTPVLVNQQQVSTIGRISMDMMVIDISDCLNVNIGDSVTLWGEGLAIETVAAHMNIQPYSLVTCLTNRVKRVACNTPINTTTTRSH